MVQNYQKAQLPLYTVRVLPLSDRNDIGLAVPFDLKVPLKTAFTMDLLDISSPSEKPYHQEPLQPGLLIVDTHIYVLSKRLLSLLEYIGYWAISRTDMHPVAALSQYYCRSHASCVFEKLCICDVHSESLVWFAISSWNFLISTTPIFVLIYAPLCPQRFSNKWAFPFVSFYYVFNFSFKETCFAKVSTNGISLNI